MDVLRLKYVESKVEEIEWVCHHFFDYLREAWDASCLLRVPSIALAALFCIFATMLSYILAFSVSCLPWIVLSLWLLPTILCNQASFEEELYLREALLLSYSSSIVWLWDLLCTWALRDYISTSFSSYCGTFCGSYLNYFSSKVSPHNRPDSATSFCLLSWASFLNDKFY